MRLGFLGPAGTFSEQALRATAPPPDDELVGFATIPAAVLAVRDGAVDRALVPIENSLEGGVHATVDTLAADAPEVRIVGETILAVRNCLIAPTGLGLDAIEVVVSHPQPLAQCARFLRERLPRARMQAATSTAEAVRTVVAHDGAWAALGPESAAALYGASVLAEAVDDDLDNETRFVWLARTSDDAPPTAPGVAFKTSIVFSGAGDQSPGWLVRCLSEFAFRGVNLVRIESRPLRGRLGHYRFHVDMEGHAREEAVAEAIARVRAHCEDVRELGTYPAA